MTRDSVIEPAAAENSAANVLSIQALRAVAALLVVLYHALELWGLRVDPAAPGVKWTNGATGVDIFFAISGFVMVISSRRRGHNDHPLSRGQFDRGLGGLSPGRRSDVAAFETLCRPVTSKKPRHTPRDLTRRQITSDFRKSCQALKSKIFRFSRRPNQGHICRHPVPLRGRRPSSRTLDGLRWTRSA
jgi:hypothetical protein